MQPTVVIGGGFGGLSTSLTLAAAGEPVILVESAARCGGKARSVDCGGEAVDTGPTVFTMRWVFEELFARSGTSLSDSLGLQRQDVLARHYWSGSDRPFDLAADLTEAKDEVGQTFGARAASEFQRFHGRAGRIHDLLRDTFMAAERPSPAALAWRIGPHRPLDLLRLSPFRSLWSALGATFSDQRLRQLYARYATYVGSSPWQAPATLMLIAHVEQQGVWAVDGGMAALAAAMAKRAQRLGVAIRTETTVERILTRHGAVRGVRLASGEEIAAGAVVHAGDSGALPDLLDPHPSPVSPVPAAARSLSAVTRAARVRTSGAALHHHTVVFGDDYAEEFDAVFARGTVPADPTVYLCAPRHGARELGVFALANAPANPDLTRREIDRCLDAMNRRLRRCGIELEPLDEAHVQTPADFARRFPGSNGAIYGRAQHGWMASFQRPGARTALPGLYLAGGSAHPGAGVPMATLSGMLAARRILSDRASAARSRRAGMPGGTPMASARTERTVSP